MSQPQPPGEHLGSVDLRGEPVHWNLADSLSYGQYLHLDLLLGAQRPLTAEHNEMLFIIVHQVSELWMRLLRHELAAVMDCVRRDELDASFKMFSRIDHVQGQLLAVWDVLSTMTPFDYAAFRNALGRSSGFQSQQYRLIEFMLGNKNAETIKVHQREPQVLALLEQALRAPSLYDEVLRLLSRRGRDVPQELLARDFSQPYEANKQVTAAWLSVYLNAEKDWDLYELGEHLVDLDHRFQLWRFQHMKTVERIIGYQPGTGGTAGVAYLAKALRLRFFPELWEARNSM